MGKFSHRNQEKSFAGRPCASSDATGRAAEEEEEGEKEAGSLARMRKRRKRKKDFYSLVPMEKSRAFL